MSFPLSTINAKYIRCLVMGSNHNYLHLELMLKDVNSAFSTVSPEEERRYFSKMYCVDLLFHFLSHGRNS